MHTQIQRCKETMHLHRKKEQKQIRSFRTSSKEEEEKRETNTQEKGDMITQKRNAPKKLPRLWVSPSLAIASLWKHIQIVLQMPCMRRQPITSYINHHVRTKSINIFINIYSHYYNYVLCNIAYMVTQMSNMFVVHHTSTRVCQVTITHHMHCMHNMHSHITCILIQSII